LKMGSEVFYGWDDFLVAEVGASAALAGLLFVAISINLTSILKYPHLPTRAIEALTTLLCVLVICSWALVPGQTRFTYGLEIGATGLVAWTIQTTGLILTRKSGYEYFPRFLFNQLPPLPFVVAGVMLMLHQPSGIYWIVPGTLLSLVAGVYCAWVLLIEIQR
jgi:hypothetical protein